MAETMRYRHGASPRKYGGEWGRDPIRLRTPHTPSPHPWDEVTPHDERFFQWKIDLFAREPKPLQSTQSKFEDLVTDWKKEIGAQSVMVKIAILPSYQKMIGMGKEILPLILDKIRQPNEKPHYWFWALAAISQENPIPKDMRGKIKEMTRLWLNWGQENGYIRLD